MEAVLKMFGTGQITLPKKWREKADTNHFMIEETPQGLLIRPLTKALYYEINDENFGLHFPMGIEAKKLLVNLKKAHKKIHGKIS